MKSFLAVAITLGLVSGVLSLKCYECDDQGVHATLATCDANATVVECQNDTDKCSRRLITKNDNGILSSTVNKACFQGTLDNLCSALKAADPSITDCLADSCGESYCNGSPPTTESPTDPAKESPMTGGSADPPTGSTVGSKLTCDNSGNFLSSTKQTTLFCLLTVAVNLLLHRL